MRERNEKTAKRFGVYDRIKALEDALLNIDCITEVDFDLDGFYDHIMQVILVPEYNIPGNLENYWDVRRTTMDSILAVAREFGLRPSGDVIEDYGKHWYIVRSCDSSWKLHEAEV